MIIKVDLYLVCIKAMKLNVARFTNGTCNINTDREFSKSFHATNYILKSYI